MIQNRARTNWKKLFQALFYTSQHRKCWQVAGGHWYGVAAIKIQTPWKGIQRYDSIDGDRGSDIRIDSGPLQSFATTTFHI